MVRIRMKRTGTRNALCFRIVVMDIRASRDGKSIELLGYYDPRSKTESIDLERYNYWLGVGAQPSDTVKAVVKRIEDGVVKDKDKPAKPSKKVKAKQAEAAAKAKAEAEAKAKAEAEEKAKAKAEAEAKAEAAKAEEVKAEETKEETKAEDAE